MLTKLVFTECAVLPEIVRMQITKSSEKYYKKTLEQISWNQSRIYGSIYPQRIYLTMAGTLCA
jgi:hypothetical protein